MVAPPPYVAWQERVRSPADFCPIEDLLMPRRGGGRIWNVPERPWRYVRQVWCYSVCYSALITAGTVEPAGLC